MNELIEKVRTKHLEATHGANDGWMCKGLIEELVELKEYLDNLNLEKELERYKSIQ